MNKILFYSLILTLSGCAVAGTLPRLSGTPANAIMEGKGDFVELFDGTIIDGAISESGNKAISINGISYSVKNIKSFQYKSEYKTTFKNRFIIRIVNGKINLYKWTIDHGYNMSGGYNAGSATHYYLQKGANGKMEYFDVKTLEEMVKDNAKALDWINQYKSLKKKNDTYLDNAISVYNK
jgi:hypothetical protein